MFIAFSALPISPPRFFAYICASLMMRRRHKADKILPRRRCLSAAPAAARDAAFAAPFLRHLQRLLPWRARRERSARDFVFAAPAEARCCRAHATLAMFAKRCCCRLCCRFAVCRLIRSLFSRHAAVKELFQRPLMLFACYRWRTLMLVSHYFFAAPARVSHAGRAR